MGLILLNHLHLLLKFENLLIHRLNVKLGNLAHRFLHKFEDVLHYYWAVHQVLIFQHLLVHLLQLGLPGLGLLLQDTVHLVLKEYLLQREIVPLVLQFRHPYLKFATQQFLCIIRTVSEDFIHSNEVRMLVHNHTGVR